MLLYGIGYFWILNIFLLVFMINFVYTGGRSGEHVHIKLHIPQVYKKHTHVQTIVKHHFHPPPPPPPPKPKKVHHYHHHHHSHKSKSKTNSHFHFENVPVHSSHSSHTSHYDVPSYKPKRLSPIYSTEYHFGGGYKPLKSSPLKYSEESFRPSFPLYSVNEDDDHAPEYSYNSELHEDIMEEPENEYDETRTTPFYSAPALGQKQPLHTSFQSSSLTSEDENDGDSTGSHWDGLISKKYIPSDIRLESTVHSTSWPVSVPSELDTYSTISQYAKPSAKKIPKYVYDSDNYEVGYTNLDFPLEFGGSGSTAKINKKWPSPYSSRLIPQHQSYED